MSFFNIDMTEVVEILPQVRQGSNYSAVNIMAADVLVIQGVRTSVGMILTQ